MYIDDPDWKGPRCRFCGAPVKDKEEIERAQREARRVEAITGRPERPVYFCSDECVRAKYIG